MRIFTQMENDIVLFNMQLPRSIRDDFKIAAKLRGSSMSTLLHQFIVRLIHEEKSKHPRRFPDYIPEPSAEPEVTDQDKQILDMVYESFDGEEVNPELLQTILNAVRTINTAKNHQGAIPTIMPGNKERKAG